MTNFFELNKLTFIESGRSDTFILRSALTRKYIRKHVLVLSRFLKKRNCESQFLLAFVEGIGGTGIDSLRRIDSLGGIDSLLGIDSLRGIDSSRRIDSLWL